METILSRPQYMYVNSSRLNDTYMRPYSKAALVQMMACRLVGVMPLIKPMLIYC